MTQEQRAREEFPTSHWQLVEKALDEHQGKRRQARRALRRGPAARSKSTWSELPTLFVTETVARQTLEILDPSAGRSCPHAAPPGAVYWFGFEHGERASVTTLVIPEEEDRSDAILASAVANEEVFAAIVSASLVFLGEVRLLADGEAAGADGRLRDVRFESAFAIDVPPRRPFDLERCRVRRQIAGECRPIDAADLSSHLRLMPGFKDLRIGVRPAPSVVTPPIRHVVQV